jgi:hypothetical protein
VDERAFRRANRDRRERAAGGRQVGARQAADDEVARRARDRERAVQVAFVLGGSAGEVDLDVVAGDRDRRADRQLAVFALEHVLGLEAPVGKLGDRRADEPLGIRVELVHGGTDAVGPVAVAELVDPPAADRLGRKLRAEVAAALVGIPHLGDECLERRLVEPRGRDDDALVCERPRGGGHAAGLRPADVGVVGARDREAQRGARHERHVGKMGAPRERVVEHEYVVGPRVSGGDGRDRVGHGAEVHGNVLGLRNHAPGGVEEGSGAVAALLDVGGESGADQRRAHLLAHGPKRRPDHL